MPVKPAHPPVSGPSVPPADLPSSAAPAVSADALIPAEHLWPVGRGAARIRTEIPGPRSRALRAAEAPFLAPGTQALSQLAGIALQSGEGARLHDVDGNTFIDWVAGIGVSSIGHGHPALAQALSAQASQLTVGSFTTAPRVALLERLAAIAPHPRLHRTQLFSGGAEAVESALRLARCYTGRGDVLGFWGGFHGKTAGVLGLMGSEFKQGLGPLPPGAILAPYADCARCPFGLSPTGCGLRCVDFAEQTLRMQSSSGLAAILVEPVQGTAGNIVPPPGWLPAIADLARRHRALLIVDEMISGLGRTGRMWGQQHDGVVGDIVTFGKGVAAGFPVSGLLSSDEIVAAKPWSQPSFSSSSFGGFPLAAAAANAVTQVIVEERLDERAAQVGASFLRQLSALSSKHPIVGTVRGRGLLLAMDLVAERGSPTPLAKSLCEEIFQRCLRRGLLTMAYSPRLRINPPLCITESEVAEGVAILDTVLGEVSRLGPRQAG